MPWSQSATMDEKTKFIADHLRGTFSISELCTSYGISRKTAYKWIDRYLMTANGCVERPATMTVPRPDAAHDAPRSAPTRC